MVLGRPRGIFNCKTGGAWPLDPPTWNWGYSRRGLGVKWKGERNGRRETGGGIRAVGRFGERDLTLNCLPSALGAAAASLIIDAPECGSLGAP